MLRIQGRLVSLTMPVRPFPRLMLSLALGALVWGCASAPHPPPRPIAAAPAPTPAPEPAPAPAPEPEPVRGPDPDARVVLVAVGDTTLGAHFQTMVDDKIASGAWTWEEAMRYGTAKVRDITAGADLAFANFEGTFNSFGQRRGKRFAFAAHPQLVNVLTEGGFDLVSLANNHALDFGVGGILDTMRVLDAARIAHSGGGRDADESRIPAVVVTRGLRIGLLSYRMTGPHGPHQADNGRRHDDDHPTIAQCQWNFVCLLEMVEHDVAALAERVDVPIVSFHWGNELDTHPRPFQVELAHRAVDAGAKLILGHHSHVLNGVEVYRGAPIFYSLGNFLFGGNKLPADRYSAIARVVLGPGGVIHAELVPIVTTSTDAPFQPTPLEGYAKRKVLRTVARRSRRFEQTITQLQPEPRPIQTGQ